MRLTPLPPTPSDAEGWRRIYFHAVDRNGTKVESGTRVRVLCLSGQAMDDLRASTRRDALAMVGEVFEVEGTDPNGFGAWIRKSWVDQDMDSNELAIELEPHEMEVVDP
jgi:hypothetical protein